MKKSQFLILSILLIPCLLIVLYDGDRNSILEDNVIFEEKLSSYNLYKGNLADLAPSDQVESISIISPLFTDYADKQRLIFLPVGKRIKSLGSGLPEFPDGTILVKTIFYSRALHKGKTSKRIIETRLLIKKKSQWSAATYQWDDKQQEAYLLQHGAVVPVQFMDNIGITKASNYQIPSRADCTSCHRNGNQILPIGPKLRNINVQIRKGDSLVNQLAYFKDRRLLDIDDLSKILPLADYEDAAVPLEKRARAYLEMNCAHCHQPNGVGYKTLLDLRYETPVPETGIWLKQGKMAYRMTLKGEMHMPQIGTSIQHVEGVQLVLDYLNKLE